MDMLLSNFLQNLSFHFQDSFGNGTEKSPGGTLRGNNIAGKMLAYHEKIHFNRLQALAALAEGFQAFRDPDRAAARRHGEAGRKAKMMVLMVSTALASLTIGVTVAYALCNALFALFRIHVRTRSLNRLHVGAKTAH